MNRLLELVEAAEQGHNWQIAPHSTGLIGPDYCEACKAKGLLVHAGFFTETAGLDAARLLAEARELVEAVSNDTRLAATLVHRGGCLCREQQGVSCIWADLRDLVTDIDAHVGEGGEE